MAEEKQQGEEVVQEPLKKEKKSLGVSLPLMIGAAAGILVIIVLGVILGVFFASKFMGVQHAGGEGEKGKTEKVSKANAEGEDEDYLAKLEDIILIETGRITTNPKGAASVFVVVNFGFEFRLMDKDNKELKTLVSEGAVNMEHPAIRKMMARIRSTINNLIASYTKEELLNKRAEIPELVKKELRPFFRDYELLLVNVTIQEFIIQE
ncbi:MAG TPA: flagellar basal body-associated FliL family protein [Candidatus Kapabacteria bacterium]|nr:flagellar basal body-associated FliL family protein [Candidatus Kapabacteria bacterium]HOM04013.1 flagellar basal body-associated FliL family protein [Candidatus Kapabacteria bacterium]